VFVQAVEHLRGLLGAGAVELFKGQGHGVGLPKWALMK
jgi:hypothetical protein